MSAAELGANFRVEQREEGWHCTVTVDGRRAVLATGMKRLRDAQCRAEAHAATMPEVAAALAAADAAPARPERGRAPGVASEAAPASAVPTFEVVSDGCICGKIDTGTWIADPTGKVSVPTGTDPALAQEICRIAATHYTTKRARTAPTSRTKAASKAAKQGREQGGEQGRQGGEQGQGRREGREQDREQGRRAQSREARRKGQAKGEQEGGQGDVTGAKVRSPALLLSQDARPPWPTGCFSLRYRLANNGNNHDEIRIRMFLDGEELDTEIFGSEIYNLDNTIIGDGLLPVPMAMGQHCCVGGLNRLRARISHMGNNNQIENIRLFVHHGKAIKCCSSCAMGRSCDCNGGHK